MEVSSNDFVTFQGIQRKNQQAQWVWRTRGFEVATCIPSFQSLIMHSNIQFSSRVGVINAHCPSAVVPVSKPHISFSEPVFTSREDNRDPPPEHVGMSKGEPWVSQQEDYEDDEKDRTIAGDQVSVRPFRSLLRSRAGAYAAAQVSGVV